MIPGSAARRPRMADVAGPSTERAVRRRADGRAPTVRRPCIGCRRADPSSRRLGTRPFDGQPEHAGRAMVPSRLRRASPRREAVPTMGPAAAPRSWDLRRSAGGAVERDRARRLRIRDAEDGTAGPTAGNDGLCPRSGGGSAERRAPVVSHYSIRSIRVTGAMVSSARHTPSDAALDAFRTMTLFPVNDGGEGSVAVADGIWQGGSLCRTVPSERSDFRSLPATWITCRRGSGSGSPGMQRRPLCWRHSPRPDAGVSTSWLAT